MYVYVCMYVYTSQPKCYEVVLYSDDDVQLLYQIYFYYMTSLPIFINQTKRYIFYLLNFDDINYLSLCMYV